MMCSVRNTGALYGAGGAWYGIGCGLSFALSALLTGRLVYRNQYAGLNYLVERDNDPKGKKKKFSSQVFCVRAHTDSKPVKEADGR